MPGVDRQAERALVGGEPLAKERLVRPGERRKVKLISVYAVFIGIAVILRK
jgi:hypothetical protein